VNNIRLLRDALSRVTYAIEILRDGNPLEALYLLEDLAHDIWRVVEREELR